jgi:hypothetical protein
MIASISIRCLSAVAGLAMLAGATPQSFALTPKALPPAQSIQNPDVQRVWWDQWGRWHPNHRHWHRWGWGPPPAPPPVFGFGVYVPPPLAPPIYEYYGPRPHWEEDE